MKVLLTFTEDCLGTASANHEIHREYIASKAKDAPSIEEEVEAIGIDKKLEKSMTIFPKENGRPFFWDYQIKGFLKDAIGLLLEISDKETKIGKTKLSKYTYKRLVDNYVFVSPRKIFIDGEIGDVCTRPLRGEVMGREQIALASSETIKAGAKISFSVKCLAEKIEPLIVDCLNYGELKGIGQWRNSGKGRFTWESVK